MQSYFDILKKNANTLSTNDYDKLINLINYYNDAHLYRGASYPSIDKTAKIEIQLEQLEYYYPIWINIVGTINKT